MAFVDFAPELADVDIHHIGHRVGIQTDVPPADRHNSAIGVCF